MNRRNIGSFSWRWRRGNAVLEAALTLPILLSLAFGTVEFGHYFFIKNTFQGAARDGVRAGIVPSATNADVTGAVTSAMNAAGISSANYSVAVSPNVSGLTPGANITVTVSSPWGTVGLRPLGLIGVNKQVLGTAVMRKE